MGSLCSLFFPRRCPLCGRYVGEHFSDGALCNECLRTLPRTEQAVVRHNGTEDALAGVGHLDKAAAYLFFEKQHPIQQMVHKMKYSAQPLVGYQLGKQAAREFICTDFFDGIDIIMPIPLHRKRFRNRGYNQSEYIARGLSEITGIPIDTIHLQRIKDTPQQALQKGQDRKNNVADAFEVNHPEQLYRKHILLVDDLITTGETVKACIQSMRPVRGATYSVFALCKAR